MLPHHRFSQLRDSDASPKACTDLQGLVMPSPHVRTYMHNDLQVNIERVKCCCSVLSDVRYENAGQGDSAMGRVVGAEPPDRRSVSACECPSWQTGFLQALPSMADTAARRSLCVRCKAAACEIRHKQRIFQSLTSWSCTEHRTATLSVKLTGNCACAMIVISSVGQS